MLCVDIVREWDGVSSECGIGLCVVDESMLNNSEEDQREAFRPFCKTLSMALVEIIMKACPMPPGGKLFLSSGGVMSMLRLEDEPDEIMCDAVGQIAVDTAIRFATVYWESKGWATPPVND